MNNINLTQSSLENSNVGEGINQNTITMENFMYQNEYREMSVNEKIAFLYTQLHKSISTMDSLIDGMMQRHEADFISAYRVINVMLTVM